MPGHPEIFVVGDLARVTQRWQAGTRRRARRQADGCATSRARSARAWQARRRAAFRYRDYGNLATIGRMAAVVDLRGFKFSGLLAWWFWLAAHVFFLIGFRNRLVVLINWAWSYWSYQRHARIIVGGERERRS